MSINVFSVIVAILIFGLLILVHEAGHYAAARLCGVGINSFAIGMGPSLVSHKSKKTGVVFSLRLLPIGGFVSMVGEDPSDDTADSRSLLNKSKLQRLFIYAAGPMTNIVIGFLVMLVYVALQPAYPSTTVANVENSVLAQYDVRPGDVITRINGRSVKIASDITDEIMLSGGQPVDIVFQRGGSTFTVEGVTFNTVTQDGIQVGICDFKLYGIRRGFAQILRQAFYGSVGTIRLIFSTLWMLVSGRFGMEAVSGPVGTVGAVAQAASMGWQTLMYFFVVISLNLGVMNLLPIPALDGGHILFLGIEAVLGRRLSQKAEGIFHAIGFALLMLLIIFVTYKDIAKIFNRRI